jgi:protein-tyrosine phosphatase
VPTAARGSTSRLARFNRDRATTGAVTFEPVIDLHCHLLPGIDDGPRTIEDSLALARMAMERGTSTIVATPHVSSRYPNEPDVIARAAHDLGARLAAEGMDLDVRTGAEIAMTHIAEIEPHQLQQLRLGGGSWLLLEPPFSPLAIGLDGIVHALHAHGHRIVLAHPERCSAFHRDPALLGTLVRDGVLTSITAGALVGRFGSTVRRFAHRLMREGMVHNVASDAHDHSDRPPGVLEELELAGLGALARWLTEEVPAAILAGEPIPAPPAIAGGGMYERPRAWWRRA